MFLLDEEMKDIKGEIYYAHIVQVVEQLENTKNQVDVLRIEMNDDRPENIPAKISVSSSEKNILIKHLRCYWETDYLWRLSKYGVLVVRKENIDLRKYKLKKLNNAGKTDYYYCPTSSQAVKQKGYEYFYPDYMKNDKLLGEYTGQFENESYTLKVIIDDPVQLEFIKDDLRHKVEVLAEDLLGGNTQYCFIKNSPYMRKMNVAVDWASWKGWSVVLKAKETYIAVIVLRRKFIPPLADTGQDFIFISKGGKNAFNIISEPADSIFTRAITSEVYIKILKRRCDALIMDEETADFYRVQLNIKPECIEFAQNFIHSILSILAHDNRAAEFNSLLKEVEKNLAEKLVKRKLNDIIQDFYNMSCAEKGSPGKIKWQEKVCRYLGYALDGGLYQSRLTLEDVIKCAKEGSLKEISDLTALKRCLKQLLHIRKTGSDCADNEDLYEPISNLVKECNKDKFSIKKWIFNEKVMISLIETSYLQRELDISGDLTAYPSLLIILLQSPYSSLDLKSAICRVTINIEEVSEMLAFKQLLPHFLCIYKERCYKLATQAAISLINLTSNNRENKQAVFKERQIIKNRLTTKDQKLLSYSIFILINLATETSRRKVIASEIREPLCNILTGKVIETNYLSSEVISNVYNALITITAKDHTSAEAMASDKELLDNSVLFLNKYDDVVSNLCWFFEIITKKAVIHKKKLGAQFIPPLIERIKNGNGQDFVRSAFLLLKTLLMDEEDNQNLSKNLKFNDYLKKMLVNDSANTDQQCLKIAKFILRLYRSE